MVTRTRAWTRYNIRVIWLSLLYGASLLPAVYGFKHHLVPDSVAYIVEVLPALPIIGLFIAIGRYLIEEQDEYVRMLMVRQTLWASGSTMSAATVYGFLQNFGLIGTVDGYWIVVIWYVGMGVGGIVNKLTLGDGGC